MEQIDNFCDYFEERIGVAAEVSDKVIKKTAFMIIIDALSIAKYGSYVGTKERFTGIIREYSDWKDCGRISLAQLLLMLTDDTNTISSREDTPLVTHVKNGLRDWTSGHIFDFTKDPFPFELEHVPRSQAEQSKVDNALHFNLFFDYRNSLVHEAKEPGYGMELSSDGARPYYHSMSSMDESASDYTSRSWEPVYPADFIASVARTVLNNVRTYLSEFQINPYSQYKFGSIWRQKAR